MIVLAVIHAVTFILSFITGGIAMITGVAFDKICELCEYKNEEDNNTIYNR